MQSVKHISAIFIQWSAMTQIQLESMLLLLVTKEMMRLI